jgi:carbon-monoxide dehydrogenase small subunit
MEANSKKNIRLIVNDNAVDLAVDPRESLADVLRKQLGLTSVKKGCDVGECGACTVLLNNRAIQSCIYLAVWADGCSIITLEGLSKRGELHPLQKSFLEKASVQCGFCTPGLIMSSLELVGTGKKYSRDEVKKHIEGHLCRCTGYENIVNAIMAVVGGPEQGDETS